MSESREETLAVKIHKLDTYIDLIDGPESARQKHMSKLLLEIKLELAYVYDELQSLREAAERYRSLADQRLLNHLEIDAEYIIEVAESLPMSDTNELGQCNERIDPIPIPNVPLEPIDVRYT